MNTANKFPQKFQSNSPLPNPSWRSTILHRSVTVAGRYVSRRYAIAPELAYMLAVLAGLGDREARQ